MTDKEHRDAYIAAAVGGVALVLIYLYLNTQSGSAMAATVPDNTSAVGETVPQTPYNYNVAPYTPRPPINFALPAVSVGGDSVSINQGCGCPCGPQNGGNNFTPNVPQFQTLIGP
jgi:hypothetical protein